MFPEEQTVFELAVNHLYTEVWEESPLWSTGGGFRSPLAIEERSSETDLVVGWPFASRIFGSWLDAGLVELQCPTFLLPSPTENAPLWADRARSRDGGYVLADSDAATVLADYALWKHDTLEGNLVILRTDATDKLNYLSWLVPAFNAHDASLRIEPDDISEADLRLRIATTDMSEVSRTFIFRSGKLL